MCVHMYACVCACVCARSCVCTLICVHGKCIYRGPQAAEARLIHMGGNVRRRRQAQTVREAGKVKLLSTLETAQPTQSSQPLGLIMMAHPSPGLPMTTSKHLCSRYCACQR